MMKTNFIQITGGVVIGLLTFSSCQEKQTVNNSSTLTPIELTGDQDSPRTLTDRISDPNIADYVVSSDYNINASVVIEPGVTIKMKNSANIFVNQNGSLKAIGTPSNRIKIHGEQPIVGYWGTIGFYSSNNPLNILSYCDIAHGGNNNSWNGIIYGYLGGQLSIENSTISNSSSYGINLYSSEFKINSLEGVTVSNCQTPMILHPNQLSKVGNNVLGTGSTFDRIQVRSGTISQAMTLKKCGLPFYFTGRIDVNAALDVEAGNHLIFSSSAYWEVSSSGSLRAIGNLGNVINFSGENAIAGAWGGIYFNASNSPINEIQHCNIGYGGNDSSWNGLVYLYSNSSLTIGNSTLHNSASYGIVNYNNNNTLNDQGTNTFYSNASGDFGS